MNTYSIPETMRVYAIGDIHGHLEPLKRMHELISQDLLRDPPDKAHIVYIGDYVDRGPDSKGVLDYLVERKLRGDGVTKSFLLGNHEQGMLDFIANDDVAIATTWLQWGGIETFESYGFRRNDLLMPSQVKIAQAKFATEIPVEHLEFLQSLELGVEIGDYVFVHAGIDPLKPLSQQNAQDLTFIREPFLSWHEHPQYKPLEKRVVHGHTISEDPVELAHRIGIDTGLWKGGTLTAVVLQGAGVRFLQTS